MLNRIVIMGRLTSDPELRRTGSGIAVASFTVAVDRDIANKESGERETDFIDCVAWRQTGEFVSKHFTKGKMIVVSGRLQIRNWNDKDGNKRRAAEVVADNCYFGEGRTTENSTAVPNSYAKPQGTGYNAPSNGGTPAPSLGGYAYNGPASDFAMLDDDDAQLPF